MKFNSIEDKVSAIKSQKISAFENVVSFVNKINSPKIKDMNILLSINENAINQAKDIDLKIKKNKSVGKLAGICFIVKACISVKGMETNCASKVLEGYISPYNASVVNKLLSEDAIILGIANMDEFACGWSGETSAYGPTRNPINIKLVTGGSSSGSAASVAADICDFSLGSDTGGSIRVPASNCGVVGLKPSYGAVSRYGLIDMCMSFDSIGPITKNVKDCELIFNIIRGQDNLDCTTYEKENKFESKKTIGLINVDGFCDKEIFEKIEYVTNKFADKYKYKIKSIKLPLDISVETYFIIVYSEFFSATRKFDGRRFGKNIEEFAGPEVIRRIFGGKEITKAEFSGRYYKKALMAREKIKRDFEEIFENIDFLILPTTPRTAHEIGEKISLKELMSYDKLTCLVNIAGIPAISIPGLKKDKCDFGIQLIANEFNEKQIFDISKRMEILLKDE